MRQFPIVDQPIDFDVSELFFSITDQRGVIKSCNDIFVRISGYERDELIGKPHSIVRHPDMPKAIFRMFWQRLKAGHPVSAFVKNRAKDGRYYWVLASALPIPEGHLSIRIKCTGSAFEEIQSIYQEMHATEHVKGIDAAYSLLGRRIQALGYASYDEFMAAAVLEELQLAFPRFGQRQERTDHLPNESSLASSLLRLLESSLRIEELFSSIFALTDYFQRIESELRSKTVFITTLARELNYLSSKVGDKAQKIAAEATDASEQMHRQILAINARSKRILEITKQAEYHIGISSLQIKMLASFVKLASGLHEEELSGAEGTEIKANARTLSATMATCIRRAIELIGSLPEALRELDNEVEAFARSVGTLRRIRSYRDDLTLRLQAESIVQESRDLDELFREMEAAIQGLEPEIHDFQRFKDSIRDSLSVASLAGASVFSLLDQQADLISSLAA